jgi:hypothetical protein
VRLLLCLGPGVKALQATCKFCLAEGLAESLQAAGAACSLQLADAGIINMVHINSSTLHLCCWWCDKRTARELFRSRATAESGQLVRDTDKGREHKERKSVHLRMAAAFA